MTKYFIVRCLEAVVAVWGVLTIIFIAVRLSGDPAVLMLPIGATEAQLAELRRALGLDQPFLLQYLSFFGHAFCGDFGVSFQHHRPALDVVLERLPATALLAFSALFLGVSIGLLCGAVAAIRRGTFSELVVMAIALFGQAVPTFWLGIVLVMIFAVKLKWLPAGGYGSLEDLALPAITVAVFITASIARLLRSSMAEILREDFIRTAYAKGLRPRLVYCRHAARAALIPVLTMVGILTGELLGGAVVAETIFSWPGVGRLIVQAIETKDFTVVQAGVAVVSIIFVCVNLAVDMLYGLVDPRIRVAR